MPSSPRNSGPDDEGVVGMNTEFGWMPLVGADLARVESLKPIVRGLARGLGKPIKLLYFENRKDVEVITP